MDGFNRKYFDQGRPVILFGPGLLRLSHGDWSFSDLTQRFGQHELFISQNQLHAEVYDADYYSTRRNPTGRNSSLEEFFRLTMGHNQQDHAGTEQSLYFFGLADEITSEMEVPPFFTDTKRFPQSPPVRRILSLGTTNTGSAFHTHGEAHFHLVHG